MENGTNGHTTVVDGSDSAPADQPTAKKQKLAAAPSSSTAAAAANIVNRDYLTPESRTKLRATFDASAPYTHLALRDLFNPAALRQVREEIINNLQATYKETDLFKVFQTGDLANIDAADPEHASKLATLLALRGAIYSEEFRQFVRDVTGCGELSAKTDCSCNTYAKGGHLLCHDDVIGTRRISYIIYLTDPDEAWKECDGGALELYPLVQGQQHTPAVSPTTKLLPHWNSMAFFTVLPGQSFHAVQEVFSEDNPRLSISGWYHAPAAPEGAANASLQQLQRGADAQTDYQPFRGCAAGSTPCAAGGGEGDELSDQDMALLLKFVNPVYLSDQSWSAVLPKFREDGSVQLQGFLKSSVAAKVREGLTAADERDGLGKGRVPGYEAGTRDGWVAVGPPHKQRYLQYDGAVPPDFAAAAGSGDVGGALAFLRDNLFKSPAFGRLLQKLTSLHMVGVAGEARRFRPGLDYTVAHYGILTKDPRLDCVLCFCDSEGDAGSAWAVGEVGGFEAYLLADEDEAVAAEVYRQSNEESGVLNVNAAHNCLNLVLRDEGLMRFVKFVSFEAPSSRLDVAMEYLPEDDSDDEDENQAPVDA